MLKEKETNMEDNYQYKVFAEIDEDFRESTVFSEEPLLESELWVLGMELAVESFGLRFGSYEVI